MIAAIVTLRAVVNPEGSKFFSEGGFGWHISYLSQFPLLSFVYTSLYVFGELDSLGFWWASFPEWKYKGGRVTESTPSPLLQLISRPQLLLSFTPNYSL